MLTELRNNYLHILLSAVVDASPIIESFLPCKPNHSLLSDQDLLEIVASKCSLPWLYQLIQSMEGKPLLLNAVAHVIVNRFVAAHMDVQLHHAVAIDDYLMLMKILQLSIHKAPVLNAVSFYNCVLTVIKDVVEDIRDVQKTTEIMKLALRFAKMQILSDHDNHLFLIEFVNIAFFGKE